MAPKRSDAAERARNDRTTASAFLNGKRGSLDVQVCFDNSAGMVAINFARKYPWIPIARGDQAIEGLVRWFVRIWRHDCDLSTRPVPSDLSPTYYSLPVACIIFPASLVATLIPKGLFVPYCITALERLDALPSFLPTLPVFESPYLADTSAILADAGLLNTSPSLRLIVIIEVPNAPPKARAPEAATETEARMRPGRWTVDDDDNDNGSADACWGDNFGDIVGKGRDSDVDSNHDTEDVKSGAAPARAPKRAAQGAAGGCRGYVRPSVIQAAVGLLRLCMPRVVFVHVAKNSVDAASCIGGLTQHIAKMAHRRTSASTKVRPQTHHRPLRGGGS